MKKCTICNIEKELCEFHKNKNYSDGHSYGCKKCTSIVRKKYYDLNKDREKVKNNIWKKNNKKLINETNRLWVKNNPEKKALSDKKYRENNVEKIKLINKCYYSKNAEALSKRSRDYYERNKSCIKLKMKKYQENNLGIFRAIKAKRRAAKMQRTPSWLSEFDLDYMKSIYIQAKELEKITGIKYHVDHIIPLQGKEVSGLHVPWNLQIITAEENTRKSNLPTEECLVWKK